MKKILILLVFLSSFSFAFRCSLDSSTQYHYSVNGVNYCYVGTSLEYVGSGSVNDHYADIGGSPDNPQFGKNVAGLKNGNPFYWIISGYRADCSDTSKCANGNTYDPDNGGCNPQCTDDDIATVSPGSGWIATNSDPGDSASCSSLVDGHQYIDSFYTSYPANCEHAQSNLCFLKLGCDDGLTYNPSTMACEDKQCGENEVFNNNTSQCDCSSGYKRVYEECLADCSQNAPQAESSIAGWVRYIDTYSTVNECSARASQFPNNNFSFNDYSDTRGCQYKICDVDEQSDDPCITAVGFGSLTPPGFVFDSSVDTVSECSSKVDGVTFSDFYTARAFPDCSTDTSLYCYLEPVHNDNNSSGGSGDYNNSSVVSGDDTNSSVVSGDDTNSSGSVSGVSNNLLSQINNTIHSFYSQSVSSDNYWKSMNAIRFNQRTSNDNANNNKLINAINKNKVDMSKTNDKLDKLIGDTTPVDVPDTSSLGDSLQDINGSFPSLDDNISDFSVDTDSLTTTTLSAYDDFASKTQDAITSMLSNIDFGIVDIFNVSTVSFVDVPISFNLPVVSTPIEGSLINADFANSLDFSLGRLAVLIGALIFSLFYIIDRLFR